MREFVAAKCEGMLNVSSAAAFCDDARMVGPLQGNAAISIQCVVDLHPATGDAHLAWVAIRSCLNLIPIRRLYGFRARLRFPLLRAQPARHR